MNDDSGVSLEQEAANSSGKAPEGLGAESLVFSFAKLPVHMGANGGESRDVLHSRFQGGEEAALHESVQPAGAPANPAHRIAHSEIICVRQGILEFRHDEQTEHAEAGDVIFVAKGTMHQVRNIGQRPAAYFVLAIGGDTNK